MNSENKVGKPDNTELEKSKAHIVVEIIEYMANSVVIKTIIRRSTGNISVMSFDSGEGLDRKKPLHLTLLYRSLKGRQRLLLTNYLIYSNPARESQYLLMHPIL
jgi:hypothetical protein